MISGAMVLLDGGHEGDYENDAQVIMMVDQNMVRKMKQIGL